MKNAGDGIGVNRGAWSFSGDVASMFDEHVSKSVPGYALGHDLILDLSDHFIQSDSTVYEIGCSTGTLLLKLAIHNSAKKNVNYIGLDIESNMIDVANDKLASIEDQLSGNASFLVEDVLNFEMEKSDLIVCYYTLQFISPSVRQIVLDKLYDRLNWGGALVLFEKVRGADARFQDILSGMYNDYKLSMGYGPEEIFSKSMSLRGVLEPFSVAGNVDLLKRAGFEDIESIFKYICFQGFVAIK
jgi:tRNA (cmo5U34)-methyltransferase